MLSLLALCLQQVSAFAPREEQPVRPNVVLILIDDVGIDLINAYREDVPCTGSPLPPDCSTSCPEPPVIQPAIDYLASRGLRFRQAWSNPLCTPTRSLLLTGKPAHVTGVGGNPQFDGSPCPALLRPGGVSFHHCLTYHGSGPNLSGRPRRSFALHMRTQHSAPVDGVRKGLAQFIDDPAYCPTIYRRGG